MKNPLKTGAAIVACALFTLVATLTLSATGITIRRPMANQRFRVGELIGLEWQHNPAHAGKEVILRITLTPTQTQTLDFPVSTQLADELITVPGPVSGNTFTWVIPFDFPVGNYEITVIEVIQGDLGSISWENVPVEIRPLPSIKFAERYGATNRVGTFPKFNFTMLGAELSEVRAFLSKDGTILGRLGGSLGYVSSGNLNNRGDVSWDLTQYIVGQNEYRLPAAGTGYSVVLGIMKTPWIDSQIPSRRTGDFVDFDETEKFTLTPPAPFLFGGIQKFPTPRGILYVIGETGIPYSLSYSTELGGGWVPVGKFVSGAEITTITVELPPNRPVGFFRLEPNNAGQTLANMGTREAKVSLTVK